MEKLDLIYPTKTGGTALSRYLTKHYSEYITSEYHNRRCGDVANPVVVFRCPYERFLSTYNYWCNGSADISQHFRKNKQTTDITDFIKILSTSPHKLYNIRWFREVHTRTQSWYYTGDYKKITVIKYKKDLSESINNLLNIHRLPGERPLLEHQNLTKNKQKYANQLYYNFVEEHYKCDFILSNKIKSNPELFKVVI